MNFGTSKTMGPHILYDRPHIHGGPRTHVDSVPMADTIPQPMMYSRFLCEIISPQVYKVISSCILFANHATLNI